MTVIWCTLYFIFLIFVFMSIFMALFVVSYETVVKENGYPSDIMDLAKWGYTRYLRWLIEWMPIRIQKKIFDFKEEVEYTTTEGNY